MWGLLASGRFNENQKCFLTRHSKLASGRGFRGNGNPALIYLGLCAVTAISTNWKKKGFQKWLDSCRYSVNSIPEAVINVMEGEITSFTKVLLQTVTVSQVSTPWEFHLLIADDFNTSFHLVWDLLRGYVYTCLFLKCAPGYCFASAIEGIPKGLLV